MRTRFFEHASLNLPHRRKLCQTCIVKPTSLRFAAGCREALRLTIHPHASPRKKKKKKKKASEFKRLLVEYYEWEDSGKEEQIISDFPKRNVRELYKTRTLYNQANSANPAAKRADSHRSLLESNVFRITEARYSASPAA